MEDLEQVKQVLGSLLSEVEHQAGESVNDAASTASTSSSSDWESSDSSEDEGEKDVDCLEGETPEEAEFRLNALLSKRGSAVEDDDEFGPRTENEKRPFEVELDPLPSDVKPDDEVERCGKMLSYNDGKKCIVLESLPPEGQSSCNAVDLDSVICTNDRELVGRVEEVFGPVVKPFYVVRLMGTYSANSAERSKARQMTTASVIATKSGQRPPGLEDEDEDESDVGADQEQTKGEDVEAKQVANGTELFVLKRHGKHVNISALDAKGSDASNIHDEEVAEDEMEYSDDEEEARAKRRLKHPRESGSSSSSSFHQGQQFTHPSNRGRQRRHQPQQRSTRGGFHQTRRPNSFQAPPNMWHQQNQQVYQQPPMLNYAGSQPQPFFQPNPGVAPVPPRMPPQMPLYAQQQQQQYQNYTQQQQNQAGNPYQQYWHSSRNHNGQ